MNGKQKYTAEDIRLYLTGKLTPSQMHTLEKEALTDPFLSDALEGMHQHGQQERFVSEVEDLRWRLKEKVNAGKVAVSTLWWKIAAVLIIIITGVAVIIYTGEKNDTRSVELAKTEKKRDTMTQSSAVAIVPDTSQELVASQQASKSTAPKSSKRSPPSVASLKTEDVSLAADSNVITDVEEQQQVISSTQAPKASQGKAERAAAETGDGAQSNSASDMQADTSNIDYEVVVATGVKKERTSRKSAGALSEDETRRRVMPENGWENFERYLKDSSRISASSTAEVIVSLLINDEGVPTTITVLQSSSPSQTREAVRLLREGPRWKVVKGKKRKITLKIML